MLWITHILENSSAIYSTGKERKMKKCAGNFGKYKSCIRCTERQNCVTVILNKEGNANGNIKKDTKIS